jgi:hypothetical protein
MKYCEQCGTKLDPGDRFCQECGYDTSTSTVQPATAPQKSRKPIPRIAYVLIAVVVLGAAGWFAYSRFSASPVVPPANTAVQPEVAGIPAVQPISKDTIAPDSPIASAAEPPKVKTSPEAKTGKGTANQKTTGGAKAKVKEPAKPAQQNTAPQKEVKPDHDAKASSETAAVNSPVKVIFEVGRKEDPKNKNPKNPTKLVIHKAVMVVRITTDHYNNGNGTPSAGSLTIKDRDGNVIGTFSAKGKPGSSGTPNAKWVAEPKVVLEKGTYFISDSDISTWSKNFVGTGMVVVEGYETK